MNKIRFHKEKAPEPVPPTAAPDQEEEQIVNPLEMMITGHLQNELEENGIIIINSEISKESLERATARLLSLHYDQNWPDDREVQIILNSPGGYMDAGWAFLDIMDFVRFPIRTVALGEIASMATIIFMSGDRRVMSSRSRAMIHHFTTGNYGSYPDLLAARKAEDQAYEQYVSHLIDCSNYDSKDQVVKYLLKDQDNWLTPIEMKEHGLCDEIARGKKDLKKAAEEAKAKTKTKKRKK